MSVNKLFRLLSTVERKAAEWQGKGWGAGTVEQELAQAASLLPTDQASLCIDIGANVGGYTAEILLRFPDCEVVVFEPSSAAYARSRDRFSENVNVTVERLAVSGSVGDATLFSDVEGSALGSLTKRRLDHFGMSFNNQETVRTIRFEDYWNDELDRRHIDLCKLDIEGNELHALKGFGEALQNIDVIQFEFGGANIDTRTYFQDFWYFFGDAGFELYRISRFGPRKITYYREMDETFTPTNYLARRHAVR